jgi:hypothetical protein
MIALSAFQAIPTIGVRQWLFHKESWAVGMVGPAKHTGSGCAFSGDTRTSLAEFGKKGAKALDSAP